MFIDCPLPAALPNIGTITCPFLMDQIVRGAFQRRQPSANASAPFQTVAAIQTLANWDTLIAAAGNTRVVLTPIFANFVIPPSEAQTSGGNDNTTFGGIRIYNGESFVTATGSFNNLPPATRNEMAKMSQESVSSPIGVSNLTWFMFDKSRNGFAEGRVVAGPAVVWRGVPIFNFRLSTTSTAGLNTPVVTNFSFDLLPDWDTYLTAFKPTFDPLVDLVPAA